MDAATSKPGSLTIVGTGIRVAGHMTLEALAFIELAEKVLYLVTEPVMERWVQQRNPTAESLSDCYAVGKPRHVTYKDMVQRMLFYVRQGLRVTAAFYGHPGLFVDPTHSAVRLARREGYKAILLPAVSAEDCLFADLRLDPGDRGCQSYEATDFLNRLPRFDPRCPLILWQVTVIGEDSIAYSPNREGLQELVLALERSYAPSHEVVIYHASVYPICEPVIRRLPLRRVASTHLPMMATLYVPPQRSSARGAGRSHRKTIRRG
jgi:uncharacterized protein YabN with tetrapyrrole methylase and pyrophosphatase domain